MCNKKLKKIIHWINCGNNKLIIQIAKSIRKECDIIILYYPIKEQICCNKNLKPDNNINIQQNTKCFTNILQRH